MMNQNDVNRAVARATGETVDRVRRMGFSLVVPEIEQREADVEHPGWRPVAGKVPAAFGKPPDRAA